MPLSACQYLHDTHLEAHSLSEAVDLLLARGIVLDPVVQAADFPVSRNYYTCAPGNPGSNGTLSYHFFQAGVEVAMFMEAMHTVTPALTIFDRPRIWHPATFKAHRGVTISGNIDRFNERKV
jgi:hypothetical protein